MLKLTSKLCTALLALLIAVPAFSMSDIHGSPITLSKQIKQGQWTLIEVWHSKCVTCRTTMPDLVRSADKIPNTQVLGISLDENAQDTRNFVNQYKIKFPTFRSSVNELNNFLQRTANVTLKGTPTWLIFSPKGQLKAMQAGSVRVGEIKQWITNQRKKNSSRQMH